MLLRHFHMALRHIDIARQHSHRSPLAALQSRPGENENAETARAPRPRRFVHGRGGSGCATTAPGEVDLPPQTLTEAPTSTAEQEAELVSSDRRVHEESETPPDAAEPVEPHADPAEKEPAPAARKHTIVIQAGATSDITPLTLQQASASERQRRAASDAPVAVITNRNLADLAEGAEVSVIGAAGDGSPGAAAPSGGEGKGTPASPEAAGAPPLPPQRPPPRPRRPPPASRCARGRRGTGGARRGVLAQARRSRSASTGRPRWKRSRSCRARWPTCDGGSTRRTIPTTATTRSSRRGIARSTACRKPRPTPRRRSASSPDSWRKDADREPCPVGCARASSSSLRPPAITRRRQRRRSDDPWEPKVLEEEPRDP